MGTFDVTFYGVRGSTPCHGASNARYGGNTSCVGVVASGQPPIMFDIGTGSSRYGQVAIADKAKPVFDGHCLLTHAHWDHIQGLPFFPPLLRSAANRLTIYGPPTETGATIREVLDTVMAPPVFPVRVDQLPGTIEWVTIDNSDFMLGDVAVKSRFVPHPGLAVGYRVSFNGRSVTYISDHQQPGIDRFSACAGVRELCTGTDLLIHDAQYTRAEFERCYNWGHSTIDYAIWLANECKVGSLALYHHDPAHDDEMLDDIVADCRDRSLGFEVLAAAEGMTVRL